MRHILPLASFVLFASACSSQNGTDSAQQAQQALAGGVPHASVCPGAEGPQFARCHAHVVVDGAGQPAAAAGPSGYGPADLQAAYSLNPSGGAGVTVGIVDAYDYPNAEADLAVYRAQFGLPPCTTANGCFKKVNQDGVQGSYPRADSGWSQEEALDIQMVSAICPNCKILLVEANSATLANLGASVNTAVRLGASAVSNSYGGSESASSADVQDYNHPGIAITVSSGDNGYGVEFPASSQYVTAVGGTSLKRSGGGFTETVWSGAGSGCSKYVAKPSWQTDTGCANRTVADVSAVADPNTGVSVYWTNHHRGGWLVFGGTSVSSPIIASVHALAGGSYAPSDPYAHTSALHDVTSGSNGTCGGSYLCTAGAGYDGPTGLGTPNGTGAF
jgi:subtilase family serine protease